MSALLYERARKVWAKIKDGGAVAGFPMLIVPFQAVPTLALDSATVQTGLFEGANIVVGALGAIVFLLIGFQFGSSILRAISSYIGGLRF